MNATEAMKAVKTKSIPYWEVYEQVAQNTGLTTGKVRWAVEKFMDTAVTETKKHGSFKVADMLHMKMRIAGGATTSQRCEPFHKRAMCLQRPKDIEECANIAHEKVHRNDQMSMQLSFVTGMMDICRRLIYPSMRS